MLDGPFYSFIVFVHAVTGTVAVIAALIAIAADKRSLRHRRAGKVYVVTIVISAVSGLIPFVIHMKNPTGIPTGVAVAYAAIVGMYAARRRYAVPPWVHGLIALATVAFLTVGVTQYDTLETGWETLISGLVFCFMVGVVWWLTPSDARRSSRAVRVRHHLTLSLLSFALALNTFNLQLIPGIEGNDTVDTIVNILIVLAVAVVWFVQFRRWRSPAAAAPAPAEAPSDVVKTSASAKRA